LSTTIAVPFTFSAGAIQTTDDPHVIARQEILDVIMTNTYERVMMPHYGAATQRLLFQTLDSLVVADYKEETLDMLNRNLSNSRAMSLTVADRSPDGSWSGPGGVESSLFVNVQYRLNSDPNTPASVSIGVVNPMFINSLTLV
jgi:phage baseplate assembly protein W|tara:strand:- start:1115 stop:1543 length:429 start_codon:yes stop_codon:yes gene_type:complete